MLRQPLLQLSHNHADATAGAAAAAAAMTITMTIMLMLMLQGDERVEGCLDVVAASGLAPHLHRRASLVRGPRSLLCCARALLQQRRQHVARGGGLGEIPCPSLVQHDGLSEERLCVMPQTTAALPSTAQRHQRTRQRTAR